MKTYLGDSVYAELRDGGVLLTTENGLATDPSNSIFLEPSVLHSLKRFANPPEHDDGPALTIEDRNNDALAAVESIIDDKRAERAAILSFIKLLKDFPGRKDFTQCGTIFDFNNFTHEQRTALMLYLKGGKWEKSLSYNGVSIDYENSTILPPPYKVRFWAGAPPPSCRIVEEEVDVPEKVETRVTPAHKETRRKLVCQDEPEPAAAPQPEPTEQSTPEAK